MSEPAVDQIKLADLAEGQSAWISAWDLHVDASRHAYVKEDLTCYAAQHGAPLAVAPPPFREAARITNMGNDRLHVTAHRPHSWEIRDTWRRHLVPVTFTLPPREAYVAAGLIFEDQYLEPEDTDLIIGYVLPQYALQLTVADLPPGKTAWTMPWSLDPGYPPYDGGPCLIDTTAPLFVKGPFGTHSVAVSRHHNGTLTARFTEARRDANVEYRVEVEHRSFERDAVEALIANTTNPEQLRELAAMLNQAADNRVA